MNTTKIVTYYGILGCWTQFIPGIAGRALFGLWVGCVLFWILLNGLGMFLYAMNKIEMIKNAKQILDKPSYNKWAKHNIAALCSYIVCGEFVIALLFFATSCAFMLITIKEINK